MRFVIFILGLALIGGVAYHSLKGVEGRDAPAPPPERLQNARDAAKRIETDWQKRADEQLDPNR